ncbi:MAG: hypothetical protein R3240_04910 [Gammaproteobacteria bacterium]|nr:hypothetical protein [Gammaproteobacteria bacterium]
MNTQDIRVILFHKHSSSARVRFLYFTDRNSVLGFESLPDLSSLLDETDSSGAIANASMFTERLGDISERLIFDDEFYCEVDVPNGTVGVSLARFTDIDPPFELAQKVNAEFREITGARTVAPVELELLQKAYTQIMG